MAPSSRNNHNKKINAMDFMFISHSQLNKKKKDVPQQFHPEGTINNQNKYEMNQLRSTGNKTLAGSCMLILMIREKVQEQ